MSDVDMSRMNRCQSITNCRLCEQPIEEGYEVKCFKAFYHPGCAVVVAKQATTILEVSELTEGVTVKVTETEKEEEKERKTVNIIDRLLNVNQQPDRANGDVQVIPTGNVELLPDAELLPPEFQHHAQPKVEQTQPKVDATLMVHAGATKITRDDLAGIETPPETDTFKPVPHHVLVEALEESLAFRRITIEREEYAVTPDGMKLFGLVELNAEFDGVRFAIGLRNANNKSMRLGMVAGMKVLICDNMALSGDFKPLLAKHSKNFDLIESVSLGVDRIQRGFEPLKKAIEFKRGFQMRPMDAQALIYRAFMVQRFPIKLMKQVHKEFFIKPSFDEFRPQTLWSLENAFTTSFKQLLPVKQYEATAKLGKFLAQFQDSLSFDSVETSQ